MPENTHQQMCVLLTQYIAGSTNSDAVEAMRSLRRQVAREFDPAITVDLTRDKGGKIVFLMIDEALTWHLPATAGMKAFEKGGVEELCSVIEKAQAKKTKKKKPEAKPE